MKTAIIYYSMGGNTAYIAARISKKLTSDVDIIELTTVKAYPDKGFRKFIWGGKSAVMSETPPLMPYSFNADYYDRIIFGFPVWASRIAPPLRTFVQDNKSLLKGKKISAYACQAGSGADKALRGLKELLGISDYSAEMVFNDPKDRPNEANEKKINEFCGLIEK
ncbi:MAG: flavodoxin [Clostridia bacterium]|jgi:flavodoxin|nr:flavodoxin [Clostridia bacterium]